MSKSRVESLTDAILAIIMTIMALEIHTPEAATWAAFSKGFIPVFAFFVSFFALTNLWMAHHLFLKNVTKIPYRSVMWNMALLFWVTLMPVATNWVADYPTRPLPERFFILVQLGWYVLLAMFSRSVRRQDPEAGSDSQVSTWVINLLYVGFFIYPLPYSALVVGLVRMAWSPIVWLRMESKGRLN
ncbi:TMEM175 family protein [Lacticaseibacillus pabuli]|uniref:TMEM175 family protein n=1 Tax=Lacticaseibacillus pabuli TaxID=3025672 RepID=A0ABY7WRV3_9LACO|nr:TMEM175 family protein [Lacticaseibacillus sp. KACC 23028]WDF81742.1 TMEM175 family protein [Lacticaseibacillus sp. KACC 23028]